MTEERLGAITRFHTFRQKEAVYNTITPFISLTGGEMNGVILYKSHIVKDTTTLYNP